jgi:hypothetical protein
MTIKKINLSKVDDFLKEIIEGATQIETFKEETEDINRSIDNSEINFKSGKISNEVYKDIKNALEKEKKLLENRINFEKDRILTASKELSKIIVVNKI